MFFDVGVEFLSEVPEALDELMPFTNGFDIGGWGFRRNILFDNFCEEIERKSRASLLGNHILPLVSDAFGKVSHAARRMGSQCVGGNAKVGFLNRV